MYPHPYVPYYQGCTYVTYLAFRTPKKVVPMFRPVHGPGTQLIFNGWGLWCIPLLMLTFLFCFCPLNILILLLPCQLESQDQMIFGLVLPLFPPSFHIYFSYTFFSSYTFRTFFYSFTYGYLISISLHLFISYFSHTNTFIAYHCTM